MEIRDIVKYSIMGVIGIFVTILIFGSFVTINAGEVGVKTRFGKIVGEQLEEGLSFKLPMIEKVKKIDVKVIKYTSTAEAASKDLQDISIAVAVNYNVLPNEAKNLYRNVGTDYEEKIINPAVQEAVKSISALYTAEQLITARADVSLKIREILETKTKDYGLNIQTINIVNFSFSPTYTAAIEAKQVAEMEVATAKNNLEKTKVEAETKIVEAEGQSKANKLLESSLTDEIVEKLFIEKWDGKLPTVYGSDGNMLDISSLIK